MTIRIANPDDAPAITAIYAPIVRDTVISFELEAPAVAEVRQRIADTSKLAGGTGIEPVASTV